MTACAPPAITLASASPQRLALLRSAGFTVRVVPSGADETVAAHVPPERAVVELARRKARAVLARVPEAGWLIAADTAVLIGADLIGKPADRDSARATLRRLAGAVHHVLTGVALATPERVLEVALARTAVTFAPLSAAQMDWYLDTGEWRGAAGGYRIQGRAALLATHLDGSYSNVVGLPLETIYRMLARSGYPFAARNRQAASRGGTSWPSLP